MAQPEIHSLTVLEESKEKLLKEIKALECTRKQAEVDIAKSENRLESVEEGIRLIKGHYGRL